MVFGGTGFCKLYKDSCVEMKNFFISILLLLGITLPLSAELKVNEIFKTGTVLQHGQPIKIFGTSDPKSRVKVVLNGKTKTVKTDEKGNWLAELRAMKPSETSVKLYVASKQKSGLAERTFTVYIGDVWLFFGGGNVENSFRKFKYLKNQFAKLDAAEIRGLYLSKNPSSKPEDKLKAYMNHAWSPVHSSNHGESNNPLSVYFAYEIFKKFEHPVGVIKCGVKNSKIDAWIPKDADLESSQEEKNDQNAEGKVTHLDSSALFNGMINPLKNFAVAGVVWYPSMEDMRDQKGYEEKSKKLITSWRKVFDNEELPFLIVQAQSSGKPSWNTTGEALPYFREKQSAALELPNTYMTVTSDFGEEQTFYTEAQREIAQRMMIHITKMKKKKTENYGPTFKKIRPYGYKLQVEFDNASSGLMLKEVKINKVAGLEPGTDKDAIVVPADKLAGFEICGRDGVFHPAQGIIKGRSVEIFSKAVRKPAAIRYGWSSIVKGNLFSKDGLPATPFRTDKIPAPNFEGELESKEVTISSIIGKPMEALMKVNTYTLEKVNVADVEAFKPVLPEGKKNYLAFFKNNISEIKGGKKPKLKIMVVFYDQGTGVIDIAYDSSDKKVFNTNSKPGTYKLAAKIKLTGTNTLRYIEVDVPDALFSNRLYGVADIRLQAKSPFIVRGIFIQPL